MALDNLRAFIGAIDAAGQLARVERPVSVDKEITEVADRCMKSPGGGPALLFTKPTLRSGAPSRLPVAVNLFGSERRMAMALGVESLDDIGARIAEVAKFPPKTVSRPPCQETVIKGADVDFSTFPVPICWPEDGGPYVTLGGVITRDPASGVRNVGMYRV